MQSVYLISNVNNGGKTYLEYLLPALNALRNKYNCIVLQTSSAGISRSEAEQILDYPVEEVGLDFVVTIKSQIIISNDAWIGRFLDDSNFGIFIAHGNVGMPIKDKYYCAELMSYWDAIVSSSQSLSDLIKAGLQLYRYDRNALRLPSTSGTLRSDLRKTSVISTLPVKIPEPFRFPPDILRTPGEHVVGLLPTQVGICPLGASLYENMEVVINAVKSQIQHAKFILRPYMTDFSRPYIKEMCEKLSQYQWITIDRTEGSSKNFYRQCDTIVTDASSGGVSFMLNTCKLPVYYVPETSESYPVVNVWREQMGGYLPIAKNSDELKDLILGLEQLTPEQNYSIYKKFYESEYGGRHHPEEVFQNLLQKNHDSDFCYFVIDSVGKIDEIVDQNSVLQPS
jgi:hypothetical protein